MLKLPIKRPVPWLIVKNKKIQLLLLYLCSSLHFEVIDFGILFKCSPQACSLSFLLKERLGGSLPPRPSNLDPVLNKYLSVHFSV